MSGDPIIDPAGYVPESAVCFTAPDGSSVQVSANNPLPVTGGSNNSGGFTATVVSGDQAFTLGSSQPLTMTTTGRLKVGLSSAQTIGGAISGYSDLIGFKDPSGNQQPANLDASGNIKVSGTFFQATQPVSGTFWQATQPVSGTFWQATQPVGGNVANASALGSDKPLLIAGSDGTSVYRFLTDTAGRLNVNVNASFATGTSAYQQQGMAANGATDAGNPVKIGGKANVSAPTAVTAGQRVDAWYGTQGAAATFLVDAGAGGALVTSSSGADANSTARGYSMWSQGLIFNGSAWDRHKKPNLVARLVSSAATTNATSVKTTAGDVYKIIGTNTVASVRYLKLYNKASAPTVGTDVPVMTIALAASAPFNFDLGANGHYFSTGIAYAITGAAADADTTAIAAGDIVAINITYTG